MRHFLNPLLVLAFFSSAFSQEKALEYRADLPATRAVNRPVSKGWPLWMKRHNDLADGLAKKEVDLLMIGDSIIFRFERAGTPVWKERYEERGGYNFGSSGDCTEHILWRLQHGKLETIKPKLTVLLIGTNNTAARRDEKPGETAYAIEAITREIKKRLPSTKILLLGIFPRGKDVDDPLRARNDKVNAFISKLHDGKTIFYSDIGHVFLNEDKSLNKKLIKDTVHPTAKGFEVWADAMEPMIQKLLKDKQAEAGPVNSADVSLQWAQLRGPAASGLMTGKVPFNKPGYEGVPQSQRHAKATQCNLTPAICDGILYFRTQRSLMAIGSTK